jgi:hypothetical protein
VPPAIVLVVNLITAAVLLLLAASNRVVLLPSRYAAGLALLLVLDAALLTAYVFGDDSYRDTGISRWDAYRSPGGALGPMFVASLIVIVAAAGLLVFAAVRGKARLIRSTALGAGVMCLFLVTPTIAGFSSN